MGIRMKRRVVPKAASYTVIGTVDAAGAIFTNRGAVGAVTFTLPTPNRAALGDFYDFRAVADQNLLVAGAVAGDILTLNDLAANSVALSTGGQRVGGAIRAECIENVEGTFKWLVHGVAVGHTYTIAT